MKLVMSSGPQRELAHPSVGDREFNKAALVYYAMQYGAIRSLGVVMKLVAVRVIVKISWIRPLSLCVTIFRKDK